MQRGAEAADIRALPAGFLRFGVHRRDLEKIGCGARAVWSAQGSELVEAAAVPEEGGLLGVDNSLRWIAILRGRGGAARDHARIIQVIREAVRAA